MNGPWRDPDTGTVVEFGSAYQGEASYAMRGGVIGVYPETRRFKLIAPDWDRESGPTPRLHPFYANEDTLPPDGDVLAVWERYCAESRRAFNQWMTDRGYTIPAPEATP